MDEGGKKKLSDLDFTDDIVAMIENTHTDYSGRRGRKTLSDLDFTDEIVAMAENMHTVDEGGEKTLSDLDFTDDITAMAENMQDLPTLGTGISNFTQASPSAPKRPRIC